MDKESGKVLIIKNNKNQDIYKYAKESFETKEERYYYAKEKSANENYLKEIKDYFKGDGIVLLINYDSNQPEEIDDVFIGEGVKIDDNIHVLYTMKIFLEKERHERTIKSIIDKIDLDINEDFDPYCYVIMSDMESLFQELSERLLSDKKIALETFDSAEISNNESYQLSNLAQNDSQAVRIYPSGGVDNSRTEFQRDRED